ncbi:MAG: sialidase family protein, partial [bacterium]
MKHFIVRKEEARYLAFPSICGTGDGGYVVAYRDAPRRGKGHTHVDPRSRVSMVVADDVRKWEGGKVVRVPFTRGGGQLPLVVRAGGGGFFLVDYRWTIGRSLKGGELYRVAEYGWKARYDSMYFMRFARKRKRFHFEKPERYGAPCGGYVNVANSLGAAALPDGTILLPVDAESEGTGVWNVLLLHSADGGRTWAIRSRVAGGPVPGTERLCEPSVVAARSGRMVCMMRAVSEEDRLYQCDSTDGGITWSCPRETEVKGHPPYLMELRDGRLLLLYGYRHRPYGVRGRLSDDEGVTWDACGEIVIRNDGGGRDLGYPRGVQLEDGSILVVYYFTVGDGARHVAA